MVASRAEPWSGLLQTAVRCNNATARPAADGRWEGSGDPSESALLLAAAQAGVDVARLQAERDDRRARLLHFDPRLKRMTTLDAEGRGRHWWHVKGRRSSCSNAAAHCAPTRAIARSSMPTAPGSPTPSRTTPGTACASSPSPSARPTPRGGTGRARARRERLTFLGLAAIEDPPRPEVADAVRRCKEAGLRIIVITGDHGTTAEAIAREVGIVEAPPGGRHGPELEALRDDALDVLLETTPELIVARSNPRPSCDRRLAAPPRPRRRDDR